MSLQHLVHEFHEAFGVPTSDVPVVPPREVRNLRLRLIREEYEEVAQALLGDPKDDRYLADLAKEMADLLYVVYGTADVMGIPLDEVFQAVHGSNMSKLDENGKPIYRADGKVLKSKDYREPDVRAVLGL